MRDSIIIITGITASGKSELCNNLTKEYLDIRIINCDSKQVYKEIPIITAQPSKQEKPYKLYGYVSARENYSVGLWLKDLKKEINNTLENLQVPIITGGSGLYISSLIKGLSSTPQISKEVRKNVIEFRKNLSKEEFYKLVLNKDPKIRGKIFMNDSYRLSRALEVITETGKSILTWQKNRQPPLLNNFKIYTILPKREDVYQKINSRFITMVKNGAIDEVKNLLSMNLDSCLPAMKAHGVPEIIKYLKGEITLNEAIQIAQTNTRRYAKRQYTWFKNQFPNSEIIDCVEKFTLSL
ncbi:tRNA (adenosine(37)-N6)-dimethylallyltransferase MiaA [Wolbachia endosymbiont of Dirofilaria (Dirofilaria) immitis]|uniref:tRNA (adenosine(37)-N6)-dimethylallyltransferase MiaA n=1 Tax=Wolbachia endosymbiont of Dirofilaria (Dirofilaria) immitis TaxID=1812115 RepID=UPI00158AD377|nr:tRNA (adenosine(37)-N6)-dimethylallyltransferase MiaA [Wolbachia endosymbiont of Dirofilaria (Dirofilaria) immitis]QKX02079.1 tRNA (adenosine(37)-N6)-dimethylallyltransferase MiaA [Wolbachia endosymbiont of Dirofilaria (Dirofilaria) immitis]